MSIVYGYGRAILHKCRAFYGLVFLLLREHVCVWQTNFEKIVAMCVCEWIFISAINWFDILNDFQFGNSILLLLLFEFQCIENAQVFFLAIRALRPLNFELWAKMLFRISLGTRRSSSDRTKVRKNYIFRIFTMGLCVFIRADTLHENGKKAASLLGTE